MISLSPTYKDKINVAITCKNIPYSIICFYKSLRLFPCYIKLELMKLCVCVLAFIAIGQAAYLGPASSWRTPGDKLTPRSENVKPRNDDENHHVLLAPPLTPDNGTPSPPASPKTP